MAQETSQDKFKSDQIGDQDLPNLLETVFELILHDVFKVHCSAEKTFEREERLFEEVRKLKAELIDQRGQQQLLLDAQDIAHRRMSSELL